MENSDGKWKAANNSYRLTVSIEPARHGPAAANRVVQGYKPIDLCRSITSILHSRFPLDCPLFGQRYYQLLAARRFTNSLFFYYFGKYQLLPLADATISFSTGTVSPPFLCLFTSSSFSLPTRLSCLPIRFDSIHFACPDLPAFILDTRHFHTQLHTVRTSGKTVSCWREGEDREHYARLIIVALTSQVLFPFSTLNGAVFAASSSDYGTLAKREKHFTSSGAFTARKRERERAVR